MGTIKLSDTLQFLTAHLNKITGGELDFSLDVDEPTVSTGDVVRAEATIRAPEGRDRTLTRVTMELRGDIQQDGQWRAYETTADAAEDVPLPGGHEYVIPIVIKIPHQAVLTEDGANWRLRATAVVDKTIDPREEVAITVVGS